MNRRPSLRHVFSGLARVVFLGLYTGVVAMGQTPVTTNGGTTNFIPVFTGDSLVSNSPIVQSGSFIGVGVNNPVGTMDVGGVNTAGSASLILRNGDGYNANTGDAQIQFSYDGSSQYSQWIRTRHSGGGTLNNAIDFYTGDGTPNSVFPTNAILGMSINGGSVGVGTLTPGGDLRSLITPPALNTPIFEVAGDIAFTQGSGGQMYFQDGTIQATAWNGVLSGGDYAESVNVSGDREDYEPGDVMVIDPASEGNFLKSSTPYSTAVAGIYSTRPGVVGRRQRTAREHLKEEVPMAMTGIVPTKVSAENGPIQVGDLLVSSSIPGVAMKGTDRPRMLGAVVGKALGKLDSGTGAIEVLVTLQ